MALLSQGAKSNFDHDKSFGLILENDLSCMISFYSQENRYNVDFNHQQTHDIMQIIPLSWGSFVLTDDNNLLLKDEATNVSMHLKLKENGSLEVVKGFHLLQGRDFTPTSYVPEYGLMMVSKFNHIAAEKERQDFFKKEIIVFVLPVGTFSNQYGDKVLHLDADTFVYKLWGYSLLEGTWTMKNNIIILKDKSLDGEFYLLYTGETLTTMLLPGDFEPVSLKKVKQ